MSGSLRDQLMGLGFKPAPKPDRKPDPKPEAKKPPHGGQARNDPHRRG
jgi:uncharacterized protein YaiL (DUF2058 family)